MILKKPLFFSTLTILLMTQSALANLPEDDTDFELEDLLSKDLEELINISSASFFDISPDMAAGKSIILNIADTDDHGAARTLYDHIEDSVSGMMVSRHERHGPLINVRGFSLDNNAKTPVMLDGQLLSNRTHYGYTAGLESPLLGDLSRAEISLSPNAIVMGGGAINGYINLIPKNGTDNEGTFASYEYGTKDKLHAFETGHGFSYGSGRDVYLYAGTVTAEGYAPDTSWDAPITPGFDLSKGRVHGFGERSYRLASYWRHDDFGLNFVINKIAPHNGTARSNDTYGDYMHHTMVSVRPKYEYHIDDDSSVEFILSAELQDFGWKDRPHFAPDFVYFDKGGSESHLEGKVIYRNSSFEKHDVAIGGSIGRRLFRDSERYLGSEATEAGLETINFDWNELSLFIEDSYDITDKLILTTGLRFEGASFGEANGASFEDQTNLSPKVALAYKWNDETIVKASYQKGYRYPDAFYYAWKPRWDAIAPGSGIEVEPETVDTFELNVIKKFPKQSVKVDASLFYSRYHDSLGFNRFEYNDGYVAPDLWIDVKESQGAVYDIASNTFDTTNGPEAFFGAHINAQQVTKSFGGEISADWEVDDTLNMKMSYGFAKLIRPLTNIFKTYPEHIIKGNIRKTFLENRLTLDVNGTFNTRINPEASDELYEVFDHTRFLLDAAVSYDLTDNISLKLVGENLLLENTPSSGIHAREPSQGILGQDERLFYLQAKVTF